MRFYLATNNTHKLVEFQRLFGQGTGAELYAADALGGMPFVDEVGDTFRENALLKAKALVPRLKAGDWALADDSGLAVDALGGAPGVYSARYAGANAVDSENVDRLLAELSGVPDALRGAQFVCVLCLVNTAGEERYFEGTCAGWILHAAEGASGFGYDPVFRPEGYERSFAVLGEPVKNAVSHRARAAVALRNWLLAPDLS